MNENISDTILVSVDFTKGVDTGVLVVGRKRPNQSVEIINALQGKEAQDLYLKLVTPMKKEQMYAGISGRLEFKNEDRVSAA